LVEIRESDDDTFLTAWTGNDPTRFPARIKAAATILKQEGFWLRDTSIINWCFGIAVI